MTFEELLKRRHVTEENLPARLLCLDPGATTGIALFEHGNLTQWDQAVTIEDWQGKPKVNWGAVYSIIHKYDPTHIICEDYRIYEHKLAQHTFSSVDVVRLIGGIDYISFDEGIPIAYQMASLAKGFATDEKLKAWGFWQKGMRHSRDAIRHGCYYLLFISSKEVL